MPEIRITKPKTDVASLPTPVEPLEELSRRADAELYVKRDDLTAGVAQGNKIRKLEYVFEDALDAGADAVITSGGIQSNHCRATAILARELGLEPHLLLSGEMEPPYDGNHLLSNVVGAEIEYANSGLFEVDAEMRRIADRLEDEGHTPYVIPVGASNPLGSLGYVEAYEEIREYGTAFDNVFVPAGSMGTYSGLLAGSLLAGDDTSVVGVKVVDGAVETMEEKAVRLVDGVAELLPHSNPDPRAVRREVRVIEGYLGDGYGVPSSEDLETIGRAGRREGLVLDPTYSGKAFRAFVERSEPGERNLFVHTGGSYGLFPKREALTRTLVDGDS